MSSFPHADDGRHHLPPEPYVGIAVTCRACGDKRRVGLLGLDTRPGDDGEPWFKGSGVIPGGWNTSTVLRCRRGHTIPIRHDKLIHDLEAMKADVGPNGHRVLRVAM